MRRRLLALALALVAAGVVLGFVFAGSAAKIADGVRVDGIDLGGLEAHDARALLERKAAAVANLPIVFVASGHRFPIRAVELGVQADWGAAVADARRQGDGFVPLRGFKRLGVQVFGADVTPPTSVLSGALEYKLQLIAKIVDRTPRDARLVRDGLDVRVQPAQPGVELERAAAAQAIVHALASIHRTATEIALPLRRTQPHVRALALRRAAAQARTVLSAPVRLELGPTRWVVPPSRLAELLELPSDGATRLTIGGPAALAWLTKLASRVESPPHDATFAVDGPHVRLVPSKPGMQLDTVRTADAILAAAGHVRPQFRIAHLVTQPEAAKVTTAKARTMGIVGLVSGFTTEFGGVANRIHNVETVAHLIDDKLIAPDETFSFNETTGERTAAKGFLVAPVIINGELKTGLGGGVCQVSTTVFNAAFDAGLNITARTNHALYISHYPQGRDATVNYPDVDLKFVNDTGHWLLLRTFVNSYSLTVDLYGTPTHRKVVSTTAPLVVAGKIPVQKTVDKTLKPGEMVVDDPGSPPLRTSVTRDVYTKDGKLLYHTTWFSSYRASPKLVRVGPKKKPKKPAPATTTTTTPATQPTG
ncbi:MAG TPA: VanW family protein [Gaiellaceae bacterium]|nr:VanW family protein [Gaiellaceae bacterium]